jgi:hypothetical protein
MLNKWVMPQELHRRLFSRDGHSLILARVGMISSGHTGLLNSECSSVTTNAAARENDLCVEIELCHGEYRELTGNESSEELAYSLNLVT